MRIVLSVIRSMLFELKLAPQYWQDIIQAIPGVLHFFGLERLSHNKDGSLLSPLLEVMTGITPNRAINCIIPSTSDPICTGILTNAHAQQTLNIENLQSAFTNLQKDVSEKLLPNAENKLPLTTNLPITSSLVSKLETLF